MKPTRKLPEGLTFEKALRRLEEIVVELEDPRKGLEGALVAFEEGVVLSRFCRSRIEEIQKRVDLVLQETPGGLETKPFEEPADADSTPGRVPESGNGKA